MSIKKDNFYKLKHIVMKNIRYLPKKMFKTLSFLSKFD